MSKLLIILAHSSNDAPLAERLLDHCYRLNGKKQIGHILLVANADTHQEMRQKIKVTAEMAFESVTETIAPALPKELGSHKIKQMNNLFRHAALTAQTISRWPWLWLEPDCAPLKPDWIAQLANAYDNQPRKYLGMVSKNANDKKIMARCGVYYGAASYELDKLCQGESPFATACADKIVESATHSPLVDYLPIESAEDIANISPKAVICHGDKAGIFAENWVAPATVGIGSLEIKRHMFPEEMFEGYGGLATEFIPPMQPNEIAKEINEFLTKGTTSPAVALRHLPVREQLEIITGRQTRRSKAEALDKKHKLDCVATEGCKSSTPMTTP